MSRITKKIREALYAFDPQMWIHLNKTLPQTTSLSPVVSGQCVNSNDNDKQLKLF
ncbi:hypothetical protein [Chifec microvirus UA13_18]|nr:hypothetical protein [Chifec microvirus UA13_18]